MSTPGADMVSLASAGTKSAPPAGQGAAATIASRNGTAGARAENGKAPAPGAAGWLSLAAAPTFALMALIATVSGGGRPEMLCAAAYDGSTLSGMVPMYVLMSAFHLPPWLKLMSRC